MRSLHGSAFRTFPVVGALLLALLAGSALATPSNKWRIQVSGGANTDGVIELGITPKEGTPVSVKVGVPKGTSENRVAQLIRDAVRAQLKSDTYKAEVDDGEDVLLKRRSGKPDFDLTLTANTVQGVRVSLNKE